jgi:hypothetical protein
MSALVANPLREPGGLVVTAKGRKSFVRCRARRISRPNEPEYWPNLVEAGHEAKGFLGNVAAAMIRSVLSPKPWPSRQDT